MRESHAFEPRTTSRPPPNGDRATPGRFCTTLNASLLVPATMRNSDCVSRTCVTSRRSFTPRTTVSFAPVLRSTYVTSVRSWGFTSSVSVKASKPAAVMLTRTGPEGTSITSKRPWSSVNVSLSPTSTAAATTGSRVPAVFKRPTKFTTGRPNRLHRRTWRSIL